MIRRALLLSLVLICLVNVACTVITPVGGYLWVKDESAPHCDKVTWVLVNREHIQGVCFDPAHANERVLSCESNCTVFSPYTEAEAAKVKLGDDNLFLHEMRHAQGYVHPLRNPFYGEWH